MVIASYRRNEK